MTVAYESRVNEASGCAGHPDQRTIFSFGEFYPVQLHDVFPERSQTLQRSVSVVLLLAGIGLRGNDDPTAIRLSQYLET